MVDHPIHRRVLALVGGLASLSAVAHAARVVITPPSIQNDANGSITFTITNLAAGQTVTVEKYADLNGNGIIDLDEPLMHSFTVTDGQVPLIAGMRNLNVPGDDDGAANGQMTVNVPYPGVDAIFSRIAGTYAYKVSSPTGGFAPLTQPFLITQNTSLTQGATGTITAAANGQGLANIPVVLVEQNVNGGFGTFTDANGNYTVYAPPGSYAVVPIANGLVIDRTAGSVDVTANQFVTKNLALNTGSFTLSGTLTDTATGAGIPGTFITLKGPNELGAIGFSDTSGDYTLPVTSGSWDVDGPYESTLSELGYLGLKSSIQLDITANVSNVDIALPKATALIYGTVTDAQGNPVTLQVEAQDQPPQYRARGRSFGPGGSYAVGVVAGTWNVAPDSDEAAAMGFVVQGATGTVGDGQAKRQDFTVTSRALACVVGTGTGPSCTELALNACLPGGGSFDGMVTFNCGGAATIPVASTKTISADTTIDGGSLITISGGNSVGVFSVNTGVTFTVQNLTIASAGNGGGIYNNG